LLNAFLEEERAIVTPVPGTTRDVLEEDITIEGLSFRLTDTAGIRNPRGKIECEGVKRSQEKILSADLVLWLLDESRQLTEEDKEVFEKVKSKRYLIVLNKKDLKKRLSVNNIRKLYKNHTVVEISALKHTGLDELRKKMVESVIGLKEWHEHDIVITNTRHKNILGNAFTALSRVKNVIKHGFEPELIALDIREALERLSDIIGLVTPEDVLDSIFERFCIGK
jgi:tRNA modification GTPase